MTILLSVGLLSCAAIALALGMILLAARYRKPINIWAGLLTVFAGIWTLLVLTFMLQTQPDIAQKIAELYYIDALLLAYCLYQFVQYYPRNQPALLVEKILVHGLLVSAVALVALPNGLVDQAVTHQAYNVILLNPVPNAIYITVFATMVGLAMIRLYAGYRAVSETPGDVIARQVRVIFITLSLVVVAGAYFDLLLPTLGDYRHIYIGPPFTLAFTGYLFYVLITQGLFDVRAALARSVGYGLMLGVLLLLYGAILFGVSGFIFGDKQPTTPQMLFYLIMALLLVLGVRPLQLTFDRLTYKLFYHNDYHLQETLQEFSSITANEIELSRIVRKSLTVLSRAISPEYVSLYIFSSQGKTYHYAKSLAGTANHRRYKHQLDIVKDILEELPHSARINDIATLETRKIVMETGASVVVKLIVRDEHIGILFLGERQNGYPYSDKDMQLLTTASDELALAIQNGLRFDEISQFNKRLRKEVGSATRELRHSNNQLHRIDEVKDEFLSIASHQLRTPLTSVKGYISMVLDGDAGKVNPQQRHLLNEAFASSQRMVSLIEDFLNMSRLQTGRFVIDKHPSDIRSMIENEVDLLRMTAKSRSLSLRYTQDGTIPPLLTIDEGKLRQVVMNFIDNAMYYSNPDSVVTISLHGSADQLLFEVKDKGIGVPLTEQAHLFGKFYRASNARRRRPDGTGVGLYLAKKVVSEHGGQIVFESAEGKGSTFGFTLPVKKLSPEEDDTR